MNDFLRIFFKAVSYVFHPLLMPTYGTLIFLWAFPNIEVPTVAKEGDIIRTPEHLAISIFINTFIMPAVAILMMKALGFVKTLEMQDKQERIIPFIATMTFYIWAFLAVKNHFDYIPYIYTVFILGTLISTIVSFLITLLYKLSIHMVGASGLLIASMLMMMNSELSLLNVFLAIVVVNGLVASARLYLKAHTVKQIYVGFMIGMLGQVAALTVFTSFLS